MKIFSSFVFFFVLLTTSSLGYAAQWDCKSLLKVHAEKIDEVREDFDHHPERYALEVPTTAIDDQCKMGNCWIYATVSEAEGRLKRQGINVNLSEAYVVAYSMLARALNTLKIPGSTIREGGWYPGAVELIRKFGIVPEKAFKPRVNFENEKAPQRLMGLLEARIAQYHITRAEKMRTGIKDIDLKRLERQAEDDLIQILNAYVGEMPETFQIKGKTYSAEKFGELLFPLDEQTVELVPKSTPLPNGLSKINTAIKTLPRTQDTDPIESRTVFTKVLSPEKLEQFILYRLGESKSVVTSIEVNRSYIDNKTGIMSIDAFPNPGGFKPIPKAYRAEFGQMFGGHLIEIVGADVGPDGRVIKYKIKNSWGEKSGDRGFYHMYRDYADEYLKAIYFSANDTELDSIPAELFTN